MFKTEWLDRKLRWERSTPFGLPVDPDVKQVIAIESKFGDSCSISFN